MSLPAQHYVPENASAAPHDSPTTRYNAEQNVQITKSTSGTNESAVASLKNTYLAVIHGATEKYVAGIRAADNKFADLMQDADFELKNSLSLTSTKNWAKRGNIIDSYVTEMLKNIDNNVSCVTETNQVNNVSEQNADDNHINIKSAENPLASKDIGSSSYTVYRNSIIAAKKAHETAVEKYKQELYNSIATAHSKLHIVIGESKITAATADSLHLLTDIPTIEAEFTMALESADANFEAAAHLA